MTNKTAITSKSEETKEEQKKQECTIDFLEIDDVIADPDGTKFREMKAKKRGSMALPVEESSECQSITEGVSDIHRADIGSLGPDTPKTPNR